MPTDKSIEISPDSHEICVLGLGFVGLTLSLVLADAGFKVHGVDTNPQWLEMIKKKENPFYEDNMDHYMQRFIGDRLIPTGEISEGKADIYIISVGTPIDPATNTPTTKFIKNAVTSIKDQLKKGDLVILRSTVPVGLSREIVIPILNESGLKPGEDYFLAFAPERTVEGKAIEEIRTLPQIVGGYDTTSGLMTEQLFKLLTNTVLNVGGLEEAEMVKLMNNTYRDVRFGYANEMALICKEMGLDMVKLARAANQGYPRDEIASPSPGVGGACLSKDSYILKHSCQGMKHNINIVEEARALNEQVVGELVKEVNNGLEKLGKSLSKAKIFIMGFAFKGLPETSDLRGSTTLDLLEELKQAGAKENNICGHDFVVAGEEISALGLAAVANPEDGFKDADAVFIMNNHPKFKKLNISSLLQQAKDDCIFMDGWYLFAPNDILAINSVSYLGVGCRFDNPANKDETRRSG